MSKLALAEKKPPAPLVYCPKCSAQTFRLRESGEAECAGCDAELRLVSVDDDEDDVEIDEYENDPDYINGILGAGLEFEEDEPETKLSPEAKLSKFRLRVSV